MKTKKVARRALFTSVLALVLCVSMLVGTTFAWFTDSVTSSNNIIKSGTLDVTMQWKDATTTGTQQTYVDASTGAIFDYDLWEPGYVDAKNIQISNVGTLALQYNLNIAANGEVSELADVIDVYFAEGEKTLADRTMTDLTRVGTLTDILAGMPMNMTGDLEANASDIVTIALKMQESAGNEYQDLSIGSDFSVILMATQDNVEKDSFDENYDDIEIPTMEEKIIEGNTYYYYNNGEVVLAEVPYGNVGSTFTVRDDVTVIGQGDAYAEGVPVFSKSSPIETITLNEGVREIKARAMTGIKTLTTVNFPSTLEVIGVQAIAQSGMTELTIPATVKEVKYGAFTASPNLKTVTVEGNTLLDNYVFRDCGSLESIYLLGDDVQFVGGGMFATRFQNGDANGITIYVQNATVAARLKAAQTSSYGYVIKILGEETDGSDASEVAQVKNSTELTEAISGGATNVILAGDMTLAAANLQGASSDLTVILDADTTVTIASGAAQSKDLTFTGDKSSTVALVNTNPGYEGALAYHDYANLTFQGITVDASQISGICARGGVATFVDCDITGELEKTIADKFVFSGCNFDVGVTQVGYGCSDVVFEGCTFETDGYGIKIYSEGQTPVKLAVKNCSFKNTGSAAKSAILLDHIIDGITYNITVENCTFDGFTAVPTPNENIWAERMIVADSFVRTADGQYIFSYQTGAEGGGWYKPLTAEQLVVTVK